MRNNNDNDPLHSSSSDELSTFLRQILSRTPATHPPEPHIDHYFSPPPPPMRLVSSTELLDQTLPAISIPGSSNFYAAEENKTNNENALGNQRSKAVRTRQRSIDAKFHNLSEKRRRSKINEKMKALQKLIPNSNKTDKASMLDEAIEYLKQLQLQVQALAVMNGLGLNPMRLPPVMQPTQTRINEPLEQETLLGGSHSQLNQYDPPVVSQEMCFSRSTLL